MPATASATGKFPIVEVIEEGCLGPHLSAAVTGVLTHGGYGDPAGDLEIARQWLQRAIDKTVMLHVPGGDFVAAPYVVALAYGMSSRLTNVVILLLGHQPRWKDIRAAAALIDDEIADIRTRRAAA